MGNQTPNYRETIRRKENKRIRDLINAGDIERATQGIIQSSTLISPDYNIISTLAIAKACEIIESTGIETIKQLAKNKFINTTPLTYISSEAIKFAENKTNLSLKSKEKISLDASLKRAIKISLGDKI